MQELAEAEDPEDVASEAADLLYFALVRCVAAGVSLAQVEEQLDRRALKVSEDEGEGLSRSSLFVTAQTHGSSRHTAASSLVLAHKPHPGPLPPAHGHSLFCSRTPVPSLCGAHTAIPFLNPPTIPTPFTSACPPRPGLPPARERQGQSQRSCRRDPRCRRGRQRAQGGGEWRRRGDSRSGCLERKSGCGRRVHEEHLRCVDGVGGCCGRCGLGESPGRMRGCAEPLGYNTGVTGSGGISASKG